MRKPLITLTTFLFSTTFFSALAQPAGIQRGAATLTAQTTALQAYIDPVTTVMYIGAAIVGIIGAFRVYTRWQQGERDVIAAAGGWFGSMLFILIANTIVRAMFL
jgi:uncharacterized protein (DUF2062 family)